MEFNGKGMASLLASSHRHSLPHIRHKKLTLGEKIFVRVHHSVMTLIKYNRQYWLTNAKIVRYRCMVFKNPQVKLKVVWTLNPVILLLSAVGPPDHDYVEVINKVFLSQLDLILVTKHLTSLTNNICKQCKTCAQNNPKQGLLPKPGF
jgi:hypothetical protein